MMVLEEPKQWEGFLSATTHTPAEIEPLALRGKRVLVTGGGGYIGAALAQKLLELAPDRLVLLDQSEHGLYLAKLGSGEAGELEVVVGSVCDRMLVREVFERLKPHIVFHAAALKHVPLMQTNPLAAIATNTLGAEIVAGAAAEFSAECFVLLSTDKAVDPVSIMGASKRLAELVVLANGSATRMTAMRLCNVLGSRGSVAPRLVRQIERGEAVTVTHPAARRYFMSLREAVQLLLTAATRPSESGILIPPLRPPSSIVDLARFLIERSSRPRSQILFTGLRAGEKLEEAMISTRELVRHTAESKEGWGEINSPSLDPALLATVLYDLRAALETRDRRAMLDVVQRAVPEYIPAKDDGPR